MAHVIVAATILLITNTEADVGVDIKRGGIKLKALLRPLDRAASWSFFLHAF